MPRSLRIVLRPRWLIIGIALLFAGAMGLGWWWFVQRPDFEARQIFLGTWRMGLPATAPTARPGEVVDVTFQPDGTVDLRFWNPKAKAVRRDMTAAYFWRSINGRLQQGHKGMGLLNDLRIGPLSIIIADGVVTWDGPDRFEYADEKALLNPQRWIRVNADHDN